MPAGIGNPRKDTGTSDFVVADTRNTLGAVYVGQGRHQEAEVLFRELVASQEKVEPDILRSHLYCCNLAMAIAAQGRMDEAEVLQRRALRILEKRSGADDLMMAAVLSELGVVLVGKGRYGEAESLLFRALGIRETTLVADHPDVALSLEMCGQSSWPCWSNGES